MVSNGALLKRISQLEQTIRIKKPRHIIIEIDGTNADQSEAEADPSCRSSL
jgi:hypothetical protein